MIDGQRATLFPRIAAPAPIIRSPKPRGKSSAPLSQSSKRTKFLSRWKVCVLNLVQFKDHHSTKRVQDGVYLCKMPHTVLFAVAGLGSCYKSVCDVLDLQYKTRLRYILYVEPGKRFYPHWCDFDAECAGLAMTGEAKIVPIGEFVTGSIVFVHSNMRNLPCSVHNDVMGTTSRTR